MDFDFRIVRALLDISMTELAEDLGLSRQTISSLERGRVKVTKVHKLALIGLIETKYRFEVPEERLKLIREMLEY